MIARRVVCCVVAAAVFTGLVGCTQEDQARRLALTDAAEAVERVQVYMRGLPDIYRTAERAAGPVRSGGGIGVSIIGLDEADIRSGSTGTTVWVFGVEVVSERELRARLIIRGRGVVSDWSGQEERGVYVCVSVEQAILPAAEPRLSKISCPDDVQRGTSRGGVEDEVSLRELGLE